MWFVLLSSETYNFFFIFPSMELCEGFRGELLFLAIFWGAYYSLITFFSIFGGGKVTINSISGVFYSIHYAG